MKFSCQSSELISALQVTLRALSVRSPQPILEGVLLEADEEGLRITASDGTFTIFTNVGARVDEQGSAVMPGRLLGEVVRRLPVGEVTAKLSSAYVLTLKCLSSRTNIAGQSAEAYPRPEMPVDCTEVLLPQGLIKDMIQLTSFAVPVEDPRAVLMGGYFEMINGEINVVGLDGFRIAMRTSLVSDTEHVVKAIIPLKSMEEIAKLMADDKESMVTLKFSQAQMMVELHHTTLLTRLIDGEYIDYRRVMPKAFASSVCASREAFARCVERASLMAREGKNNLIKFTIEGDKLYITSNSEAGDVFEEMDVVNEGEDIAISFNVKYLLEITRVISGDEIMLKFNSPVSPCVIAPVSGGEFTYLVLPVRGNA